jgi:type II secretory pathway component PulM
MKAAAFWVSRSPRERSVIAWMAAAAAALLAFALVWLPMDRARTRIAGALPSLRASVAEMRAQAAEAKELRAMPVRGAGAPTSIASLIASGTLTQGLPGARLSALDAKRARLAIDDASWTRLVEWLSSAHATHGLTVEEAMIDALAAAGRVRATVVLVAL